MSRLKSALPALVFTFLGRLECHDWREITPVIKSQVQKLQHAEAETLLSDFCEAGIKNTDGFGLTCAVREPGGLAFADIIDKQFHPQGVIYGHFLSPTSVDAMVSGWSAETHPALWGGTLLLTKRSGKWMPLWYRSAVITHSCQKLRLPSGREILMCEDEDGGMGHRFHFLYSVDATSPKDVRETLLAVADSFQNDCTKRRQKIHNVEWSQTIGRLSVIIQTPQWRHSPSEMCAGDLPPVKRPPLSSVVQFELTDRGLLRRR